jgi:methylated-DNA-[protein]-cysteine S-methyltransferase
MSDRWDIYDSPLGSLTLTAGARGLRGIAFPGAACPPDEGARDPAALAPVAEQLDQYFAGERRSFDLTLALTGSEFQTRVWERLLEIPYGTTVTYGELALAVGRPDIVRGVAAAVGRTPIPIVIPCHRVLGAGGALTGYGGGLHRKRALLGLERRGPAALGVMAECGHRQLTLL